MYSDTDRFVYNITHPGICEWIKSSKQQFDFPDYKREDMHDNETQTHRML